MMKNIFMVMNGLEFKNGGITSVMMNRSHYFNDLGHRVYLVTFDGDKNYRSLEKQFKEVGKLNQNTKIINFFEYYCNKNSQDTIENSSISYDNEFKLEEPNFFIQKEYFEKKSFSRYFNSSGMLIKTKFWINGQLDFIEYYRNNILVSRKYASHNSFFSKEIFYNSVGEDIQVNYYTTDGFCYFQRSFLGERRSLHLFLYNKNTKEVKGFNSYLKLHTFFIESLCDETGRNGNVIICDGPGSSEKVVNVSNMKAKRYLTIHSNHFAKPFTFGSPVKEGQKFILESISKVDGVIVLTESQKRDLVQQFGYDYKFIVIPNTIGEVLNFQKTERAVKKITIVSRYVAMKQLDHIIESIRDVVAENKNIEVNFYGSGPEQDKLVSLVGKYNLDSFIKINEYTTDVNKLFKETDLTLFTSQYEGFGLVLIEAMSHKVPVISYDLKYGPSDIIRHGIDGFIIEKDNVKLLTKTILSILSSNKQLIEMSENSFLRVKDSFTHEVAKKLWMGIL